MTGGGAARLVLVDGIPGSGKSVISQTVARSLRQSGQPVRWTYEEELGHPIYVFHDAATLQSVADDLFSGAHERVLRAAVDKWARFAAEAQHTATTLIADGAFFGYLTWVLHYLDRPVEEALAYIGDVQAALAPLPTRLIYLRQRDVAATMRNVQTVRGAGWTARMIQRVVDSQ